MYIFLSIYYISRIIAPTDEFFTNFACPKKTIFTERVNNI